MELRPQRPEAEILRGESAAEPTRSGPATYPGISKMKEAKSESVYVQGCGREAVDV
jgi:hypothetical protein